MQHVTIARTRLISGYAKGETIATLASRFGTSRATIQRRLRALGVPTRRTGPALAPQSIRVPVKPAILGYIAGLFDGEGNIYWRRRTHRANSARIAIYSTTATVMDWLRNTVGGYVRWSGPDSARARRGWKPMGVWEINRNRDCVAFLGALIPYLIIKRDLATVVLADLTRNVHVFSEIERSKKRLR